MRLALNWQRKSISYFYGFQGDGIMQGDPKFEITQSYPSMDRYYGVLTGVAYSVPFALSPIFLSLLKVDYNRVKLLCFVVALAGLSTLLTGMVNSFPLLFVMRMVHAVCFSLTIPIVSGLVRGLFPQNERGLANSLLKSASYFGIAISSLSILLINSVGWRGTYCAMGAFGTVAALLSLPFLREGSAAEPVVPESHNQSKPKE